jgi:undecaprenyl-diphosphatase
VDRRAPRKALAPLLLAAAAAALGAWVSRIEPTGVDAGVSEALRLEEGSSGRTLAAATSRLLDTPWKLLTAGLLGAFVLLRRGGRAALFVLLAFAAALASTGLAKETFPRDRPSAHASTHPGRSYPSGHALQATALCGAAVLALARGAPERRRRPALLAATAAGLAMGWSRVALHRHWPSDVLGGLLVGLAVVWALAVLLSRPGASKGGQAGGGSQVTAPPGRK